jgi:tripartite-type tricarboxylate transporter receptor subunit TctC
MGFAQTGTPLRVILPVSAGSAIDAVYRSVAPSLSKALGQPVVGENLAGASSVTGTTALVRAAPDGQTIAIINNNHVVNPSVFARLPYDSLNDITPISIIGESPFVLVVNPDKVPARNAKELVAFLKQKPGVYNYASSGNGSIVHLAGAMFADAAEVEIKHIPYKGTAPQITDIVGGQVEMGVMAYAVAQQHLKSGKLRAIGVTGRNRVPSMPELPTLIEQGLPGVDVTGWFAVIAPARLPQAEVRRLHAGVVAAFAMPEAADAMAKQENLIHPTTPEEATRFLRSEQERYGRLVKKLGVTLD